MSSTGGGAIVTLGAGPAGLSFSSHLGHQTEIYEKEASWGGRCRSHVAGGFIFDEGPHSSFTRDNYVRELFARSVEGRFNEIYPDILNRFGPYWLLHPVQTNLKGLPEELVIECIVDFVKAGREGPDPPENYGRWLVQGFGEKFARTFPYAYTRKYWTVEPEFMSTDWIKERIYRPDLAEVLRGAISGGLTGIHYISSVRYPVRGGFQSFLEGMRQGARVHYGCELARLELKHKKITFKNGCTRHYERLVSTIPLPELVRCIRDCPAGVMEAASRLDCTSVVLVNLGIKREDLANCHWFYIYDEERLPCRVHFPCRYSADTAPPGFTGIQAEVYYSRYRPLAMSLDNVLEQTILDITAMGLFSSGDSIDLARCMDIKYANVLCHRQHAESRRAVLDFLEAHDIHCIGRYGEWDYLWSDQSILRGKQLAERLVKKA